ncbi:MAG: hypothetical protein ACRC80_29860 [Waterburya sp.]
MTNQNFQDDHSLACQFKAIPPKHSDSHSLCKMIFMRFGVGTQKLKHPILTIRMDSQYDYWMFIFSSEISFSESLFFEYELRKFLIDSDWKIVLD